MNAFIGRRIRAADDDDDEEEEDDTDEGVEPAAETSATIAPATSSPTAPLDFAEFPAVTRLPMPLLSPIDLP